MEVDQRTGVNRVEEAGSATNPAVVNVVDRDWETEDGLSDESSTDLSSMYFEDDASDDDQASMTSDMGDGVSVYCYPYSLQRMRVSSPLRSVVMIKGKPVEAEFDTGASQEDAAGAGGNSTNTSSLSALPEYVERAVNSTTAPGAGVEVSRGGRKGDLYACRTREVLLRMVSSDVLERGKELDLERIWNLVSTVMVRETGMWL
ncbi:hypothetical protein G6F37_012500 [Rhizopus arrhizus]|nr:hypothetical protein G6F38_012711 [Rhizopus arrhizus]KAG1143235.1 hypothetical protein G6F37_012500 [Rhizopus arrhizus]